MLNPFYLECGDLLVHPFRSEDLESFDYWVASILDLFSDDGMLVFIPEKRMVNHRDAENWLKMNLLNFYAGQNYVHFVTDKAKKTFGDHRYYSPC